MCNLKTNSVTTSRFWFWITVLTNKLCSNSVKKFIINDNVISKSYWGQSSSGAGSWDKNIILYLLLEIKYLTNKFCSNVVYKFIVDNKFYLSIFQLYLIKYRVQGQNYLLCLSWNYIFNKLILFEFCLLAHYHWQCLFSTLNFGLKVCYWTF